MIIGFLSDHASLFVMSSLLQDVVGQDGKPENPNLSQVQRAMSVFPFSPGESPVYRGAVTDIYRTKDWRFYHVHGGKIALSTYLGNIELTEPRQEA
jgi:hypothetical protein